MSTPTVKEIARELNARAEAYEIGTMQELRAELKELKSPPGKDIFRIASEATQEAWAFHWGGRRELQFNIGFEDDGSMRDFRHGVAFSLEPSQTLPEIDPLLPKIRCFNDFLRQNPDAYVDMRLWYHKGGSRSLDHPPGPIPSGWVREGVFVFFGKKRPLDQIDYDEVLTDFDRLLPLYEYVESHGDSEPVPERGGAFEFTAGFTSKRSTTVATPQQKQVDVTLRHNDLQEALHRRLASKVGAENVGTENLSGGGTRVDVVVRRGDDRFWFYEIKTALTARGCIREALGQLLEYSFYPRGKQAERLIVVGEAEIDDDSAKYLSVLRERFGLPVYYEGIELEM